MTFANWALLGRAIVKFCRARAHNSLLGTASGSSPTGSLLDALSEARMASDPSDSLMVRHFCFAHRGCASHCARLAL